MKKEPALTSVRIGSQVRHSVAMPVKILSYYSDGHRAEYAIALAKCVEELGFSVTTGEFRGLFSNERSHVLCGMLDDRWWVFLVNALLRQMLGRYTTGLFFRSGECFRKSIKYKIKYAIFYGLSRLPRVSVLTILPFEIEPRLAEVASGWIFDPQLWDLSYFDDARSERPSPIVQLVRAAARGRRILVTLGGQNRIKGFNLFTGLWCGSELLRKDFLFVAAGSVDPACESAARHFAGCGGLLIDRRIERQELHQLYRSCDVVWSCYAPDYDQASGIFGRAVQYGVPVVVRRGSYLEKLGVLLKHPTLAIDFDIANSNNKALCGWHPANPTEADVASRVASMRAATFGNLLAALSAGFRTPHEGAQEVRPSSN